MGGSLARHLDAQEEGVSPLLSHTGRNAAIAPRPATR
jgi:hypothetical protein